jgi:tetratricopeptide (TPR) repeat protein
MNRKEILHPRLLFFFLLFLIAMSYSNTLFSPFVLDDYSAFIRSSNMYLKDLSFDSLSQLLHTRFGKARLIPIFTFALDHYLGKGQSIANYHATNIIIHLLATAALAMFLKALLRTKAAAGSLVFFRPAYFVLAVCGLWALAPVQTNAVTYIVQRMTSIASLFYLAACAFYIYARLAGQFWQRITLWCLFVLAAICAFFSKENSATLPLTILLLEFMFITPGRLKQIIRASRWYHWVIIFAVILLVFPVIQYKWHSLVGGFSGRHYTLSERLFTQLRIVVFYISLLVLPLPGRMNLDHDFSLSSSLVSPLSTLLALFFLLGFLALGFYTRRKNPLIAFGIFWFYLNLVIESSFVPLELIFEHRLYLPSIGFFLVAVTVADIFLGKYGRASHPEIKKIVFLAFLILIAVSSILTTTRNYAWRDRVSLYQDCFEKSPHKARTATNYAMALGRDKRYEECVKYGLLSQTLGQQGYEDYLNSATNTLSCLLMQEKYDEAVETGEMLRRGMLGKNLKYISAGALDRYMFNLGRAYTEVKEYEKAMESFRVSLFRNPAQSEAFLAINKLVLLAQEDEEGKQALDIGEAKYAIPIYLARIAMKYRQYEKAALYLQDAQTLEADPGEINPMIERFQAVMGQNKQKARESNIAKNETYADNRAFRLYLKAFDFIEKEYWPLKDKPAGWLLQQAGNIDPENPFLPVYWARWHMRNGRVDAALVILEDSLRKEENFVPVLEQLGLCYQQKKDYPKIIEIFTKILDIYPGNPNWKNYLSYVYKYEDMVKESTRTPFDYY